MEYKHSATSKKVNSLAKDIIPNIQPPCPSLRIGLVGLGRPPRWRCGRNTQRGQKSTRGGEVFVNRKDVRLAECGMLHSSLAEQCGVLNRSLAESKATQLI